MDTLELRQFQAQLERLDALLRDGERSGDPRAQQRVRDIVQAVLDLHGAALQRLLEILHDGGEAGRALLDACGRDDLVSGLLLLHDLHPLDLETRLHQALEGVRPYLHSHGGNVELLGIEEGVVRLRLQGSCHSCPSSTLTMRQTIEEAIYARAPEVVALEVEGLAGAEEHHENGQARLALPMV